MWTSMGAQFIKHINWDDLATSGWKHLFPMQSNSKKFEEIWRFILLIRSLFRRWAGRQHLKAVVWERGRLCHVLYIHIAFHLSILHYFSLKTSSISTANIHSLSYWLGYYESSVNFSVWLEFTVWHSNFKWHFCKHFYAGSILHLNHQG